MEIQNAKDKNYKCQQIMIRVMYFEIGGGVLRQNGRLSAEF